MQLQLVEGQIRSNFSFTVLHEELSLADGGEDQQATVLRLVSCLQECNTNLLLVHDKNYCKIFITSLRFKNHFLEGM